MRGLYIVAALAFGIAFVAVLPVLSFLVAVVWGMVSGIL